MSPSIAPAMSPAHTVGMHAGAHPATEDEDTRIIVYQSTDRSGSTFALSPDTRQMLKERFGAKFHGSPRIFIAHEIHEIQNDLERLHGKLAKQLVTLLTGLEAELLGQVGDIEFMDPVTEELL